MTEIQALVHDVFGTVVDWRAAVTADGEALAARKGITGVDWQQFADQWRGASAPSVNPGRTRGIPWTHPRPPARQGLRQLFGPFGVPGVHEERKIWCQPT